jgi:hypothetical protein
MEEDIYILDYLDVPIDDMVVFVSSWSHHEEGILQNEINDGKRCCSRVG